jgi:hypothetical protein
MQAQDLKAPGASMSMKIISATDAGCEAEHMPDLCVVWLPDPLHIDIELVEKEASMEAQAPKYDLVIPQTLEGVSGVAEDDILPVYVICTHTRNKWINVCKDRVKYLRTSSRKGSSTQCESADDDNDESTEWTYRISPAETREESLLSVS